MSDVRMEERTVTGQTIINMITKYGWTEKPIASFITNGTCTLAMLSHESKTYWETDITINEGSLILILNPSDRITPNTKPPNNSGQ